jgi:outer membrane immunogenic protein
VTTAYAQRFSASLSWFGTARGRIGFLPIQNLLLFATGGFAYGEAQLRYELLTTTVTQGIGTTTAVFPFRSSKMLSGYTAGVGAEYALTEACGCTIKAEYLWVDLGKKTLSRGFSPAPGVVLPAAQADFTTHVVRLGVNFYFSGLP